MRVNPINVGQSNLIYAIPEEVTKCPSFNTSYIINGPVDNPGPNILIIKDCGNKSFIGLTVSITQTVVGKEDDSAKVEVFNFERLFEMVKVTTISENDIITLLKYCVDFLNQCIQKQVSRGKYLVDKVDVRTFGDIRLNHIVQSLDQCENSHQD